MPPLALLLSLVLAVGFQNKALADDPPLVPNPANLPITDATNWLASAQYFWDSTNNPVPVSLSPGETFATGFPGGLTLEVDLSSLSNGLHQLGFRVQDNSNRWSDIAWLPVQVQDATTLVPNAANLPITDTSNWLTYAEYFWDAAPALSNGAPVSVAAAETFATGYPSVAALNVDLSSLSNGLHQLGFRTVDASGRWSETNWLPVQVQDATTLVPNPANLPTTDANNWLIYAEYFWDIAPALSNGVPVNVAAAETFAVGYPNALPLNVDLSSLSNGLHQLGFRTVDASGRWSETNWLPVQVLDGLVPNPANLPITDAANWLVYAEYFWDAAPALSNGVPVSVAAAETFAAGYPSALALNVDLSSLSNGLHQLGFRTVDASGRWSETNWLAVQVQDATTLVPNAASFPITDAANWLTAARYSWDDFSNAPVSLALPPGETFGTGFPAGLALSVDLSSLSPGLHQLGFQVQDANGRWSETNWLPVQVQDATTLVPNPASFPITDAANHLVFADILLGRRSRVEQRRASELPGRRDFRPRRQPFAGAQHPRAPPPLGRPLSVRAHA